MPCANASKSSKPTRLANQIRPIHAVMHLQHRLIVISILALGHLAPADPGRDSTNYHLIEETTKGGYGVRASSSSYTLDHNGGISTSQAISANYTSRDGFTGQLADVIALQTNAASDPATEDSSVLLSAVAVFDDDSLLPIIPTWHSFSGAIISVDSTGLATTAVVYAPSPGSAQATYSGITEPIDITVADTNNDNFGTYSADGLPDHWQVQHFGINDPNAAPGEDPDGDGQDNLFEYLAGTVPINTLSLLQLSLLTPHEIELSLAIPDRTYTLMRSLDLIGWSSTGATLEPSNPQADISLIDPFPVIGVRAFYRIDISD